MGKRNQGLNTAARAAKEKRQEFITEFELCDSYKRFQAVLSKFEKHKDRHSFVPKKLKPGQASDINQLDIRIKELIMSKYIEFSPSVEEVTVTAAELSSAADALGIANNSKESSLSHAVSVGEQTEGHTLQPPSTHVQHDKLDGEASSDTHQAPPKKPTFNRRDSLVKENLNNVGLKHIEQTNKTNQPSNLRELRPNFSHPDKGVPAPNAVDSKVMNQRKEDIVAVSRKLVDINEKHKEFVKEYKNNIEEYKRQRKAGNKERAEEYQKTAQVYKKAAKAAKNIFDAIDALSKQYIQDGDINAFKSNGKAILHEGKDDVKELQNHRGCKLIVINLLALICSVGIAHLGYSIYKGGFSLFHPATDAQNKVEDLHEAFNTLNMGG